MQSSDDPEDLMIPLEEVDNRGNEKWWAVKKFHYLIAYIMSPNPAYVRMTKQEVELRYPKWILPSRSRLRSARGSVSEKRKI